METNQWKKLDELFHQALDHEPEGRVAFISQVQDDYLRRELTEMLAHYDEANSFIESPAYVLEAETILDDAAPDHLIGKTLGPYRVLGILGKGGMGVVYRALDVELQRKVALKFLHPELTGDKSRVLRFKQEARAASALNHPNILTVFAIGEIEGHHFISTELVEGETLRELMKTRRMNLSQIISFASQISSALAAAHGAGIMHRDIKPENIMLRPDGYLKVLDFGLAKLIEQPAADSGLSTFVNTEQGTIIGTIQYMSPEQARGLPVDARTDIWSLGVVLYEMLASQPPFEGKTKSDVMVSILEHEPAPLTLLTVGITDAMQGVVTKTLQKDRLVRYQTAEELVADLQKLSQSEPDLERPLLPHVNRHLVAETARQRPKSTDDPGAMRPASSAEYIVSEIRHHKFSAALVLFVLASITAGVGLWLSGLVNRKSLQSTTLSKPMTITRLTTSGTAKDAVLSPDGKYVAYTVEEAGKRNLRLRQIGTTSDIQIAGDIDYGRLTFSRDGSYLYYSNSSFFHGGDLYQVPSLGGPTKLVLKNVDSTITFSPDGKRFAFVREDYPTQGESSLMIANADGTGEQKLTSHVGGYSDPDWSPDGKLIATIVATRDADAEGYYGKVVEVEVDGGREKPVNSRRWLELETVKWLSDGRGLLLLANDRSVFSSQIWQLSYPVGEARKVTNDFNTYRWLSISADSTLLVSVQEAQTSNIWIWSNRPGNVGKQITSGAGKYFELSWTHDGKLIYGSDNGGSWDIWRLDVTGPGTRQLTANAGLNGGPSVSADGRRIAFVSIRANLSAIWVMDVDGGNPKQLTAGFEDDRPTWSPDGQWLIFDRRISGLSTLWKIPSEGGSPIQLTDKSSSFAVVSPDGKLIACTYRDKVVVIPFEGGSPLKSFEKIQTPFFSAAFKWTLDGKALTYTDNKEGVDNVWTQPLSGGPPKQLTNFTSEKIFSFAWSRDGQLAISRGVETGDVVLITDFRQD